ncbi:MAG: hypothetical protein OEY23_13150 [Acidimicrobiia bacterium]|nr:hypothetical protein [Acidimicrobiia bacterium]
MTDWFDDDGRGTDLPRTRPGDAATPVRAPRERVHARSARVALGVLAALASILATLLAAAAPAAADGTETLGPPSIAIADGTGISVAGIGLFAQPATLDVTVPAGATVLQVLLYWESGHRPGDTSGEDSDASVTIRNPALGGPFQEISADHIGIETGFFGDVLTSTHRADVTALGLVGPGTTTLEIDGLDFDEIDNGAGVAVIYDQPERDANVTLRDGSDVSFVNFDEPLRTTIPQTFDFDASPQARTAKLALMASSVHDPLGDDTPTEVAVRPHVLRTTVAGATTDTCNPFGDVGPPSREFDAGTFDITIPAGATSLTVQLLSLPCGGFTELPASLVWLVAALELEAPPAPDDNPPPTPPGPVAVTVGDRVWFDRDRDGIQDPGEPGVKGVEVELSRVDGAAVLGLDGQPATTRTTTDDSGIYLFRGLAPGAYQVHFLLPDTQPARSTRIVSLLAANGIAAGGAGDLSPTNAGSDDAIDSDGLRANARPLSGEAGQTEDLTVDLGLVTVIPITGSRSGVPLAAGLTLAVAGIGLLTLGRRLRPRPR